MKTAENKFTIQIEMWSFIGPVLTGVACLLLMIKPGPIFLTLPLTAIVGLALSWKWGIKGFMCSLGMLLIAFVYQEQFVPSQQKLWTIGYAASLALAMLITALTLEEANSTLEEEDKAATQVNATESHTNFDLDQSRFKAQIKGLESSVQQKETEIQSHLRIIVSLKNELESVKKVQNELDSQLKQAISEKIAPIQSPHVHHEMELEVRKKEIEELKIKLDNSLVEIDSAHRQVKMLSKDLSIERDLHEENKKTLSEILKNQSLGEDNHEKLVEDLETANRDKSLLETSMGKLHQTLEQLKNEIQEKELLIQSYQYSTQSLQSVSDQSESLIKLEREKLASLSAQYQAQDKNYQEQLSTVETKWVQTLQELSLLQEQLKSNEAATKLIETQQMLNQERFALDHNIKEIKRLNGVYRQLREQYEEKSSLLDETRRTLFLEQEASEIKLIQQKESQLVEARTFTTYMSKLQHEIDQQEAEIEQLTELVSIDVKQSQPKKAKKAVAS